MIRHLDVYDEIAVANMQKDVQDCLDEVEHWRLRFDLQSDAKKLENTSLKYCPSDHSSPSLQFSQKYILTYTQRFIDQLRRQKGVL